MAQQATSSRRTQVSTTIEVLTAVAKNHKIELDIPEDFLKKGLKGAQGGVEWSFKVRDRLTIDLSVSAPPSLR